MIAKFVTLENVGNWRIRRRDTTATGAILFILGFIFALIGIGALPAAYADSTHAPCATEMKKTIAREGGGEADWRMCIKDGNTEVQGWVTDTANDKKCAQAMVYFANDALRQSDPACDGNRHIPFTFFVERTDSAEVSVRVK